MESIKFNLRLQKEDGEECWSKCDSHLPYQESDTEIRENATEHKSECEWNGTIL